MPDPFPAEQFGKGLGYARLGVKQNAKVKQNVMILEVFVLGRQRIDQKRKKGWGRGRREGIEKGSRERIEIERKETKGN